MARVALCPTGCKNTAGKLFDIGHGGCEECTEFNAQTVAQQGVIGARLIEAENEMLRAAAASAIPLPQSPNKEAKLVAISAQNIHASMLHASLQSSRYGPNIVKPLSKVAMKRRRDNESVECDDEKLGAAAAVLGSHAESGAKKTKAAATREQDKERAKRNQFAVEDDDDIATYKTEVICWRFWTKWLVFRG